MTCSDEIINAIYELTKVNVEAANEDKENELKAIREIVEPLMKLIADARQKKMYLFLTQYDKWFSPDELESEIKNGCNIYAIDLWCVKSPIEMVQELENEIMRKELALRELRIEVSRYLAKEK